MVYEPHVMGVARSLHSVSAICFKNPAVTKETDLKKGPFQSFSLRHLRRSSHHAIVHEAEAIVIQITYEAFRTPDEVFVQ